MASEDVRVDGLSGWALILGASSGFGAATALALARSGMDVFGVHLDRRATLPNAEKVKAEIEALGRKAVFFNVNAADPDKIAAVSDEVKAQVGEGTVRVLMHSLAFGTLKPFFDPEPKGRLDRRQFEMTLDVMANSLVYWSQALDARGLLGEGTRIYAMTSEGSTKIWPSYGAVSAAKSALESHIRQIAFELAPRGVTANAILAGVTDTPALRKIPGHEDMIEEVERKNPSRRLTTPDDVAGAICALTLPACGWITGNTLRVDGGEHLAG